jgi:hypothetical protein
MSDGLIRGVPTSIENHKKGIKQKSRFPLRWSENNHMLHEYDYYRLPNFISFGAWSLQTHVSPRGESISVV